MSQAVLPAHVAMSGYHQSVHRSSPTCPVSQSTTGDAKAQSKLFLRRSRETRLAAAAQRCGVRGHEYSMRGTSPTGHAPDTCNKPKPSVSEVRKKGAHVRSSNSLSRLFSEVVRLRASTASKLTFFIAVCMTSLEPTSCMHAFYLPLLGRTPDNNSFHR